MIVNKVELLKTLKKIQEAIEKDDSVEGKFWYSVIEAPHLPKDSKHFELTAAYSTGNSKGECDITTIAQTPGLEGLHA